MDSACYFDLLGESVPLVSVSVHALALLGFFSICHVYNYIQFERRRESEFITDEKSTVGKSTC